MNKTNASLEIVFSTIDSEVLSVLLKDFTTQKGVLWATDAYAEKGTGYQKTDEITISRITGSNEGLIIPRYRKKRSEQEQRSHDHAEVFTPAWLINEQNNLIDNQICKPNKGFTVNRKNKTWFANQKLEFIDGYSYQSYINRTCLEVACGEAPYLVTRYDATSAKLIPIEKRVGRLDRKFRVINRFVKTDKEWLDASIVARQSVYGYELQGDNLVIGRINLFLSYLDYYRNRFNENPNTELSKNIATIISWNLFQMDGLKLVVPYSCHNITSDLIPLFGEAESEICPGCKANNPKKHNGKRCYIRDWKENRKIKYIDLLWGDNYGKK